MLKFLNILLPLRSIKQNAEMKRFSVISSFEFFFLLTFIYGLQKGGGVVSADQPELPALIGSS